MSKSTRVIKKYPNRRMYDLEQGKYITLADIRRLVTEHVEFTVIDHQNQADITCKVLLQVIVEKEQTADGMFGRDLLSRLIRSRRIKGSKVNDV